MARIRSDKPEAYQSETLAEISLAAERTFKGMATIVDDRGRLADKPAQINGELWSMRGGHTKEDLEAELQEMAKVDLICRYTGCDGKKYLHLVRWDKHQKIDRPSKSRLPRCAEHRTTRKEDDYCGLHEGECKGREPSAPIRDTLASDSRVSDEGSRPFHSDSMQDLGSRTVDLGSRTVDQIPPAESAGADTDASPVDDSQLPIDLPAGNGPPSRKVSPADDPLFGAWYSAYPLHKARGDAEKAWVRAVRERADPHALIEAAKRYAKQRAGQEPKFTKHPATWLNQKCWLDEEPPPASPETQSRPGIPQVNYPEEEYTRGW
jgi:hypothetical protein